MKSCRTLFIVLLPVVLLAACATTDTRPELLPGEGRIFFYRIAPKTTGSPPTIYVNGKAAARATPYMTYYYDVLPGSYEIDVNHEKEHAVTVTVEEGKLLFVRIDKKEEKGFIMSTVVFFPTVVDYNTGRDEIKRHKNIDVESVK